MPRPTPSEVALYRAALRDVNTLAQRDLLTSWRQFNLDDAAQVRDGLMDLLPGIIATHHLNAATVAADWYDLQRYELGAKKRFRAIMAEEPTDARGVVMARWGVAPMFGEAAELAAPVVLSKIAGGLQRVVTDGARQTIVGSAARDPGGVGWARVGAGGCDFCRMLIGRGAVYSSEATASFDSHDHCGCDAVIEVA